MIHSPPFPVILDACVLYPAPLRDFLLHLADVDLFKPKWTDKIQSEWLKNLLEARKDLQRASLEKTVQAMNGAFPDANVTGYEPLVAGLKLPDIDDCHVLAAAIRTPAQSIITSNLKDFPPGQLKPFDIEVLHPDNFIADLINLDKTKVIQALNSQVAKLKHPPKTKQDVMTTLEKNGLVKSIAPLKM